MEQNALATDKTSIYLISTHLHGFMSDTFKNSCMSGSLCVDITPSKNSINYHGGSWKSIDSHFLCMLILFIF